MKRGLRVSLIKHAHHTFDVDQPGKDSYRHRHAGASEVLVTSSRRWVLMHELRGAQEPSFEEQVKHLSPCDLLIVEGFKFAPIPKLEVWRAETGEPLLHPNDPHIVAIASDAKVETRLPLLDLNDDAGDRGIHRQAPEARMNKGLLSVDEALAQLLAGARPVADVEEVPTSRRRAACSRGRRRSTMDVPPMDNSAMDGYAVRLSDLNSPEKKLKVAQRIPGGLGGQAARAGHRGAHLYRRADSAGRRRDRDAGALRRVEGDSVVMKKCPKPGEWIRRDRQRHPQGRRDPGRGQAAAAAGHRARGLGRHQDAAGVPQGAARPVLHRRRAGDAGRAAAAGAHLQLQPLHAERPGATRSAARCATTASCPTRWTATREVLRRAAAENDLIVTSGGVSVGDEDHVKPAVEAEGSLLMWKIAMKPGPAARFRQGRQGALSSACRAIRCRAS